MGGGSRVTYPKNSWVPMIVDIPTIEGDIGS